jgi:hypothetical protein
MVTCLLRLQRGYRSMKGRQLQQTGDDLSQRRRNLKCQWEQAFQKWGRVRAGGGRWGGAGWKHAKDQVVFAEGGEGMMRIKEEEEEEEGGGEKAGGEDQGGRGKAKKEEENEEEEGAADGNRNHLHCSTIAWIEMA